MIRQFAWSQQLGRRSMVTEQCPSRLMANYLVNFHWKSAYIQND